MLRSLTEPEGWRLSATDGEIGRCRDFLFDELRWTVRYLVADTGRWLPGRKVLIGVAVLDRPTWEARRFPVRLTRRQIEDSPSLDADAPVSRRYERTYHDFFQSPYYWLGNGLWGNFPYPGTIVPPSTQPGTSGAGAALPPERPQEEPEGTHLRSLNEVTGYGVRTRDGKAGRVVDFLVDDASWQLRFAVVDTSWLPFSKTLLVATDRIGSVSWVDREIRVDLPGELIEKAPDVDPSDPVSPEDEARLDAHYGRGSKGV